MSKSHKITQIPRVLHHQENACYLIGRHYINGFNQLDVAIRNWMNNGGDYLALANGSHKKQSSIVIHDTPTELTANTYDPPWHPPSDQPLLIITRHSRENIPTENIVIALSAILSTQHSVVGQYVVYQHHLQNLDENAELNTETIKRMPKPSATGRTKGVYTGITRQGWDVRHRQHISATNCGSNYLFHRAIRGAISTPTQHYVYACGLSFKEAMNLEEELVEQHSLYPKGLNMIPGGFAGIRYLAKHGFKAQSQQGWRKNWEYRERTIAQFTAHCIRTSRPNPLAAANWKNNDYALAVILNNRRNFTSETIKTIRDLHSAGFSHEDIATRMMVDSRRVRRLLNNITYKRVPQIG